jgi:hypothetical protein
MQKPIGQIRHFMLLLIPVFASLDLIATFPEMGLSENKRKHLYSFLIHKNCRVFYRVQKSQIFLLAFIDMRSDKKRPS